MKNIKPMKLLILFFHNKNEGGCEFGKEFTNKWINNEKKHPDCNTVEIKEFNTGNKSSIILMKGEKEILKMVGNQIRIDLLQEKIFELKKTTFNKRNWK